jgi:hypothetical protein
MALTVVKCIRSSMFIFCEGEHIHGQCTKYSSEVVTSGGIPSLPCEISSGQERIPCRKRLLESVDRPAEHNGLARIVRAFMALAAQSEEAPGVLVCLFSMDGIIVVVGTTVLRVAQSKRTRLVSSGG